MRLAFRTADQREVCVEVTTGSNGYAVSIDGEPVELQVLRAEPGELDLRVGDRRVLAYVAAQADERFVFLDGRVHALQRPSGHEDAEDETGASGPRVTAPMPGKIVKLLVDLGAEVAEGTGLIILESMKMETEISAPVAGTVAAIHVVGGQTVSLGEALLDIEPAAG